MANKQIIVNIETTKELDDFISLCKDFYQFDENEVLKLFVKVGFQNEATDYIDALYKGAVIQKEFLQKSKHLIKLKKVTERKIQPANVVEKNLSPLVHLLQDDELVDQIKRGEI